MAEQGYFREHNVLLFEGEIIELPQQKHPHCVAIHLVYEFLKPLFPYDSYQVRQTMPLSIGKNSDPEPDVAVIEGSIDSFDDHPTTALMVVEISDFSLELDRRKAMLYAEASVPEYWIVDLHDRQVEVYRDPLPAKRKYRTVNVARQKDWLTPIARPDSKIEVTTLLRF